MLQVYNIVTPFFLTSLLEYNCFTMLYYFLLYNEVNQLYVCLYPLRPGPPSHAPHPTRLGRHRAPTELSFLCFIARSH